MTIRVRSAVLRVPLLVLAALFLGGLGAAAGILYHAFDAAAAATDPSCSYNGGLQETITLNGATVTLSDKAGSLDIEPAGSGCGVTEPLGTTSGTDVDSVVFQVGASATQATTVVVDEAAALECDAMSGQIGNATTGNGTLEVNGIDGENITAGAGGINADPGACSSIIDVTNAGSYQLSDSNGVLGSAVTLSAAGDNSTVGGPATLPVTIIGGTSTPAGDHLPNGSTLKGGSGTNTYTVFGSGINFDGGSGNNTYTVTGSNNIFNVGSAVDTINETGSSNLLNLGQVEANGSTQLVVNLSGTSQTVNGTTVKDGQAFLGSSLSDSFTPSSAFNIVDGSTGGNTDFLGGTNGGLILTGSGSGNSADFSQAGISGGKCVGGAGLNVSLASGTVTSTKTATLSASDSIGGITNVTGSNCGGNTFLAGTTTPATYTFSASGGSNAFTATAPGSDTFNFTGSGGGNTFTAGTSPTADTTDVYNFTGNGDGNTFIGGNAGTDNFTSNGKSNAFEPGLAPATLTDPTSSSTSPNTVELNKNGNQCLAAVNVSGSQVTWPPGTTNSLLSGTAQADPCTVTSLPITGAVALGSGPFEVVFSSTIPVSVGQSVTVSGVAGLAGVNGTWTVNGVGSGDFGVSIPSGVSGTYTPSTGQVAFTPSAITNASVSGTGPFTVTFTSANPVSVGNLVTVFGVGGLTGVNGTWTVTAVGSGTFSVSIPTGVGGTYTPSTGQMSLDYAISASPVYTFTGLAEPIVFDGSTLGTTFFPGNGSDTFNGEGGSNELNYSSSSGSKLTINASSGTAALGGSNQSFSDISRFDSLSGGNTTFASSQVAGDVFNASGTGNAADYTNDSSGVTADFVNGTITDTKPVTSTDTFTGITSILGSDKGGNDFVAGNSSEVFGDAGPTGSLTNGGDTIDFTNVPSGSGLTVNESGQTSGIIGNSTAVAGSSTYTFSNVSPGFTNDVANDFTTFIGSGGGNTDFLAGNRGGLTFTGAGASGNAADFSQSGVSGTGITVDLSSPSNNVTSTAFSNPSTADTVTGITSVTGSNFGHNTFTAGTTAPATFTFTAGGGHNMFSASSAGTSGSPDVFNFVGSGGNNTFTATSISANTYTFTGNGNGNTFNGGDAGSDSFTSNGSGNTFNAGQAGDTISDPVAPNTVNFSNVGGATAVNVSGSSVTWPPTTTNSVVTGTAQTCTNGAGCPSTAVITPATYTFTGLAEPITFEGSTLGTTFYPGTGGDTFTGEGGPSELNYGSSPGSSLNVNVGSGTAQLGGSNQTFNGITTFDSLKAGDTTFASSGPVGDTFNATGSGNTLDYSQDLSPIKGDFSLGAVTPLSASSPKDTFSGITSIVGSRNGGNDFIAGTGTEQFGDNGYPITNVTSSGGGPFTVKFTSAIPVSVGSVVTVEGVGGLTGVNGIWTVTATGAGNFSVSIPSGVGGTYTPSTGQVFTGTGDTLDLSHASTNSSSALQVNATGGAVGSLPAATAAVSGSTYTFTNGSANFTTFVGAGTGFTEFLGGSTPGLTFNAKANMPGDSADFSADTTAPMWVNLTSIGQSGFNSITVPAGDVQVGTTDNTFDTLENIATVTGPKLGTGITPGSTFAAGAAGPYSFTASGSGNTFEAGTAADTFVDPTSGNTVNLSGVGAAAAVNVSGSQVTWPGNGALVNSGTAESVPGTVYTFTGLAEPTVFDGSSSGTTFYAGTAADTFTGEGTVPGNNELSYHFATISPLTVNVATHSGTAVLGGTNGVSENFSDMGVFDGLSGGSTTFVSSVTAGNSFKAAGTGNEANYTADNNPVTFDLASPTNTASDGGAHPDDLSGITEVMGSSHGANKFIAGTGSEVFGDSGSPVSITGVGFTGTTPGPFTVTFTSSLPVSIGTSVTVNGVGGVTGVNGTWTVTGVGSGTFSVSIPSGVSGTYTSGTGHVFAGDTVDLSNVSTSSGSQLIDNVSGKPVSGVNSDTAAESSTTYTFDNVAPGFTNNVPTNFNNFVGALNGNTQFVAGDAAGRGGYTFTGQGSGNTADFHLSSAGITADATTTGLVTFVSGVPADTLGGTFLSSSNTIVGSATNTATNTFFGNVIGTTFTSQSECNEVSYLKSTTSGVTVNFSSDKVSGGLGVPDIFSFPNSGTSNCVTATAQQQPVVQGTTGSDTFKAGTTTATVWGGGGDDTLDLTQTLAPPVGNSGDVVDMQAGTVSGATIGTLSFTPAVSAACTDPTQLCLTSIKGSGFNDTYTPNAAALGDTLPLLNVQGNAGADTFNLGNETDSADICMPLTLSSPLTNAPCGGTGSIGSVLGTLTSATGTASISSLGVTSLAEPVSAGDIILVNSGTSSQQFTVQSSASAGATSITVDSATPVINFPAGSTVADIRITFTGASNIVGTHPGGDHIWAGTSSEQLQETGSSTLDMSNLPGITSTGVTVTAGATQSGTVSAPLSADSFSYNWSGFSTIIGTAGNDSFTQTAGGTYNFIGLAGTNTLDLSQVSGGASMTFNPADATCSAGNNSDGTAVGPQVDDTWTCMSNVTAPGQTGFSISPNQSATVNGGGSGTLNLINDTVGSGAVIDLTTSPATVRGDGYSFNFTGMSTINGTPYDDTFIPGSGNVTINGGGGQDGISYTCPPAPLGTLLAPNCLNAPNPVDINLSTSNYLIPAGYAGANNSVNGCTAVGGFGGSVNFLNSGGTACTISNGIGTTNNTDILIGGTGPSNLTGGKGNDRFVLTDGGIDTVVAGTGNTTLDLSELSGFTSVNLGDPFIQYLPTGSVTLASGNIKTAIASPGGSFLQAGTGSGVTLVGGPGNDILAGGDATDGGALPGGTQTLTGGGGNDILVGGIGNDTITGGAQPVIFIPGEGNDTLVSSAIGNTLDYAGGLEGAMANLSSSSFRVPAGKPFAGTTLAADTVTGGFPGSSANISGANITNFIGSPFADAIVTGGNDTIDGNGGNDLFVVGSGTSTVNAGTGTSSYFLMDGTGCGSTSCDNILRGGGNSTIDFSSAPASVTVNLQSGQDSGGFGSTDALSGFKEVIGTTHPNDVLVADAPGETLIDLGLNDLLQAGPAGDDTLRVDGGGGDTFCSVVCVAGTQAHGGPSPALANHMYGGSGSDTFFTRNYSSSNPVYIYDYLVGGSGNNNQAQVDPQDTAINIQTFLK